jgi:acetyltransferase
MDATTRYPVEWIDRFQLARGDWITLRPVLPQDDVQEREFVAHGLTSQSRYLRFQVGLSELPETLTQAFTHIDYHDHFALVAESFGAGSQTQVGDARFVRVGGALWVAEFGFAVADAWHCVGFGRRLLCLLVAGARAQGVTRLYGDVLRDNAPMLALARASGFVVQSHPDNATLVRVQLLIQSRNPGPKVCGALRALSAV